VNVVIADVTFEFTVQHDTCYIITRAVLSE